MSSVGLCPLSQKKIAEMLFVVLNLCNDEQEEELERIKTESEIEKEKRRERLRAKVKSVSKVLRMYSTLVKERETIIQIKSFTPGNKLPPGILSGGVEAIKDAFGNFDKAKKADQVNEKRPIETPSSPSVPNIRLKTLRESQERSNSIG